MQESGGTMLGKNCEMTSNINKNKIQPKIVANENLVLFASRPPGSTKLFGDQ